MTKFDFNVEKENDVYKIFDKSIEILERIKELNTKEISQQDKEEIPIQIQAFINDTRMSIAIITEMEMAIIRSIAWFTKEKEQERKEKEEGGIKEK